MSDRRLTDVTHPELGDMSESISVPVGCEEIKLTQRMTNHVRYSEVGLKIGNVERDIADGGRDDPLSGNYRRVI